MLSKKYILAFLVSAILLIFGPAMAHNKVLVSGNGFQITQGYLNAFISFYNASNFTSTREEFMEQAVKVKVFSSEASLLDLEPAEVHADHWEDDFSSELKEAIIKDIGLAETFMMKEMAEYPLEDLIIESYYRSNPEKFFEGSWSGADLIPLDNELKIAIRSRIINFVVNRLVNEAYLSLKDDYEVKFLD